MPRDPLAEGSSDDDAHMICAVAITRRICGLEAARKLVRDFAGTHLFIPRRVWQGHRLSKSIGFKHAAALVAECGGVRTYIPMTARERGGRRRGLVYLLLQEGKTVGEIARATKHSERTIVRDISILRQQGAEISSIRHHKRKSI